MHQQMQHAAARPRQYVLITGGSSGIGLALAQQCAARGRDVVLIARDARRLEQAAAQVRARCREAAQRIVCVPADVGDRASIRRAIEAICDEHEAPAVAVMSAGIAVPGHFGEMDDEVFSETMRINYFGSLYTAQALLPHMQAAGIGTLVFIASGAALTGIFGYSAYAPSKFAVRGLAEVLRAELKPLGIQVSIAYPPDTDTPQYEAENRTKPQQTRAITGAAGLWPVDRVAEKIMRGIERGRFAIPIGAEVTSLYWLHSLIQPLLFRWFDRLAKRRP